MNKIDFKSMLIGFLLCAVGILSINATVGNKSKYQIAISSAGEWNEKVYEAVINTETGVVTRSKRRY